MNKTINLMSFLLFALSVVVLSTKRVFWDLNTLSAYHEYNRDGKTRPQ